MRVIVALAIVANYITDDGEVLYEDFPEYEPDDEGSQEDTDASDTASGRTLAEIRNTANILRDRIAHEMWQQYQEYLALY